MKIIFGLGNPEPKYDNTPHNAGFKTVDKLCEKLGGTFGKKKLNAQICECVCENEKIILAKPQTYMNNSGECVLKFVKKFKIPLKNVLIILDDIDLNAGDIRFRESGSAGTHNGMRNIVSLVKTKDIPRLRVGVGKPPEHFDLADFVLAKMSGELLEKVESGTSLACEKALEFLKR